MKNALVTVELANALRGLVDAAGLKAPYGDLGFMCPECKKPVKPHSDGMQGPHFEHLDRNKNCSLSDV
jgi:hypothetical protein